MIKIFITVRNRLAITKKCIEAIKRHSELKHQIYVYDNLSTSLVKEHFEYFYNLYSNGHISQVTFNTKESTFNAFSKAAASNQFGHLHEDDPRKDEYDFLLILDNDIILTPGYDTKLKKVWQDVKKMKMNNIKVIGQVPGGIKRKKLLPNLIGGFKAKVGQLGGSGLWSIYPDFFRDVGYLPLKNLVGHNKKHDQMYWKLMSKRTKGQNYILGIKEKIGIHCGSLTGSMCSILTRGGMKQLKKEELSLLEYDKIINDLSFDDFYKNVMTNQDLIGDW